MSTGYVVGVFDTLTIHDVSVIQHARQNFDEVVVGVIDDGDCTAFHSFADRSDLASCISGVTRVVKHDASAVAPGTVVQLPERAGASPAKLRETSIDLRIDGHGAVVGYVPGGWDMFHVGHLNLLRNARKHCGSLVVGVVTDKALTQAKGRPAVVPLHERMDVVGSLTIVDDVVVDTSSDKLKVWDRVRFDVLFKGDDWQGTPRGDKLETDMASVGVRVHYFPYTERTSTTKLRTFTSGYNAATPNQQSA